MNNIVRDTLCELIKKDRTLCDDPKRCEFLLKDFCRESHKEIHVIICCFKGQIVRELLNLKEPILSELLLVKLIKRLEDEFSMIQATAKWAIESWAMALGIVFTPFIVFDRIDKIVNTTSSKEAEGIKKPTKKAVSLVLRYKSNITIGHIFYKNKLGKISDYIAKELLDKEDKPIILTGYHKFGGSFLIEEAIKKGEEQIGSKNKKEGIKKRKKEIKNKEKPLKQKIYCINNGDLNILSSDINNWILALNSIKKQFKVPFKRFSKQYYKNKYVTTSFIDRVKRLKMFAVLEVDLKSFKKEAQAKIKQQKNLEKLLVTLAYKKLPKKHKDIRFLFLFDKIDLNSSIETVKSFFDNIINIGGRLRIIVILNKYNFDKWVKNEQYRNWFKNFNVVECLPEWRIAEKLCDGYFEVDDKIKRKTLYKKFLGSIDFFCWGSPAKFRKVIYDNLKEGESVTLSEEHPMIKFSIINSYIEKEWKSITEYQFYSYTEEEYKIKLYLLYLIDKILAKVKTYDNAVDKIPKSELFTEIKALIEVDIPKELFLRIFDRLINVLVYDANIIYNNLDNRERKIIHEPAFKD